MTWLQDACCCVLNFLETIALGWLGVHKEEHYCCQDEKWWMNEWMICSVVSRLRYLRTLLMFQSWNEEEKRMTLEMCGFMVIEESKTAPGFRAWDTVAKDESPTLICSMLILDNCWCEPNSRNSVLSSLSFKKLAFIHWRILFMQSSSYSPVCVLLGRIKW